MNRRIALFAAILTLFIHSQIAFAITDPTQLSGLELWLDASDAATLFTNAGCSTPVSADGQQVQCWQDKSGNANHAEVPGGKTGAFYRSAAGQLINGNSILKFNKTSPILSSVYEIPGVDARAGSLEDVTIVTVYRPRTSVSAEAIWGVDNGGFDRFAYTYFPIFGDGIDDGAVGLGPDQQIQVIDDAGQVNVVRLLTVIYDGNVTGGGTTGNEGPVNGSKIFFGRDLIRTFTDTSDPTNGQTSFFVGWDGDDGTFDGDIAEVILYNRVLEPCELNDLSQYLATKYGQDFAFVAPGGVNNAGSCNALWLRADAGITLAGSNVNIWQDQSGAALTFTPDAVSPSATAPDFVASAMNFNPMVTFNSGVSTDFLGETNFSANPISQFTTYLVLQTEDSGSGILQLATGASPNDNRLVIASPENLNFNVADDSTSTNLILDAVANGSPDILSGTWNLGTLNTFQNGFVNPSNPFTTDSSAAIPTNSLFGLGQELDNNTTGGFNPAEAFNGDISEVIFYRSVLSTAEQLRVESYLAIKYGIALEQFSATGAASPERGDYVDSTGALLFDAHDGVNQNPFPYEIIGIGRDDASLLDQRISRTLPAGPTFAVSTDSTFTGASSSHAATLGNRQFLMISSNGATPGQVSRVAVNGATAYEVLDRRWAAKDTGNVGTVNLRLDLSSLPPKLNGNGTLALIVDDDGNLASGATIVTNGSSFNGGTVSISESGNVVTVTNIDLSASAGTQVFLALALQQSPTVSWTSAAQTAAEDGGNLSLTAALSFPSNLAVSVPYTVNVASTAAVGLDYSIPASPLLITAGAASNSLTITISDDALLEGSETVIINMQTPVNADPGATVTHTVTIADDELAADDDADGISNLGECPAVTVCPDSDGDGTIDRLDTDSDNDGSTDSDEGTADTDGDGIADRRESNTLDSDADGLTDVNDSNADGDANGNDGSGGEQDGIGAGVWRDTDGDGIPDHLDADDRGTGAGDSDGDGILDDSECPSGYVCADSDGNGIPDYVQPAGEILASPTFMIWNGFLQQANIAVLANKSAQPLEIVVTLLGIDGNTLSQQTVVVAAKGKFDFIINEMPGYSADSYGLARLSFNRPLALEGHFTHYRISSLSQRIESLIAQPLQNTLKGASYGFFNTIQPSMRAGDEENGIPNWAQIGNAHPTDSKTFTVRTYNAEGVLLDTRQVTIPPLGRRDVAAGHELAVRQAGTIEIIPDDSGAEYTAQLYHYSYDTPLNLVPQTVNFALGEGFRKGSAAPQYLGVSRGASALNWIALGNVDDTDALVNLQIIANDGTVGFDENMALPALSQRHLLASAFLPAGQSGGAIITPLTSSALISNSRSYYFAGDASVTEAGLQVGRSALATKPLTLYNTFLEQANWLRVFNLSTASVNFDIEARDSEGASLGVTSLSLPAKQGIDVELETSLGFAIGENRYGQVQLSQGSPGALLAENLRFAVAPDGTVSIAKSIPAR